jgi:glycosyltransferase involved in cell wall biosynthesis/2-polyprenyl-3-methyl-5-hydroxy-6-metoxy-1,4-benzoquinol methylase
MSSLADQRGGHWLDPYLAQADGDGFSFLEVGCGDGLRLQKAVGKGAQCFAIESDVRQRDAACVLCPDAYIVASVDDIPPHAFDLILISPRGESGMLQNCLYQLAAKGSFKPTTTVVAMTKDSVEAEAAAATLSLLRFGTVKTAEAGPHRAEGYGRDFTQFMQERYVPGTWSEIAAYEHLPRYQLACGMAQGARVLDFGCGSGYGTAALARVAAHVTGLDISEDALTYARSVHNAASLAFINDAAFGASLPSHSFDLITCFEVIEHLEPQSQDELLVSFGRLLTPNGRLLISTPNPHTTSLYGSNPYHLCELSRREFAEKLRQHFPHLAILDQWVVASVVFQPETAKNLAQLNDLSDDEIGPSVEPAIFVAICGMEPIGDVVASVYLDRTRDFVRTRIQSLHWRDQQLVELYDLQHARRQVDRLALAMQQAITQLQDKTVELDGVLADRAALRAKHAESEAALEESKSKVAHAERECALLALESRKEIERAARQLKVFRDLTEELTLALTDMEMQTSQESAELQAQAARDLANVQAVVAEQERQGEARTHEAQLLASKLRLIEQSTTWRAVKRVMPALRVARPVVRPPAVVLWRAVRRLRNVPVRLSSKDIQQLPPHPSSQIQTEDEPSSLLRDLSVETALDPVWDPVRSSYTLRREPSVPVTQQPQGLARPYVVRSLTEIDPSIRRPRVLHVIPNVHVGGSTQLVIDLVQHLSAELEHEVLTSSLWQGEEHEGLTTHLVPDPNPAAMGEVIDRVAPDLIHFHYWGLTDEPWYRSVLTSIKGRGIATIQNVNTPVVPLLDNTFKHYVFVSDYVRREFGGSLPEKADVSVIHPGIDISRFATVTPAADRENAIGMVYRLEDDKLTETAIEVFIEIVRRRPRTKVYIIGGGRFLEPYITLTETANVRENFRFTGYVPYTSLPGWYDKFAIFIAPVWKESFGQVAPFAMAKRQAVVGFKVGALPEILGSDATLGAGVSETAHIASALLDDPERLRQIGEDNAARASEMFTIEAMVERYREVYASLVDLVKTTRKQ